MIICIDTINKLDFYNKELKFFEEQIYIPLFPCEDEREDFSMIKERVKHKTFPETKIYLLIEGNTVKGGAISDYFESASIVHHIYLAVKPEFQRHGIGKQLLQKVEADAINNGYKWAVLEADNPVLTNDNQTSMDPVKRLNMYLKWGFNKTPYQHIQPALDSSKQYDYHLLLLHKNLTCENFNKQHLISFVKDFFKSLNGDTVILQEVLSTIKDF